MIAAMRIAMSVMKTRISHHVASNVIVINCLPARTSPSAYWDFRSALGCGRCRREASLGALLRLDAGVDAPLGAVRAQDASQDEEEQGAHDHRRQQ